MNSIFDIEDIFHSADKASSINVQPEVIGYCLFLLCLIPMIYFFYMGFFYKEPEIDPDLFFDQQTTKVRQALKEQDYDLKKVYFELMFILKNYLLKKIKLNIKSKTDTEIIDEIKKNKIITKEILQNIQTFILNAGKIRFANHTTPETEKPNMDNFYKIKIMILDRINQLNQEKK